MADTVLEAAPAKVNLTLHVIGQRADGYHLLQSLVVFPKIADRVHARNADSLSLTISGPFASSLKNTPENLVLRAALLMGQGRGAAIRLEKNLPVASGIGGGSSDAAATLRLLSRLWALPVPGLVKAAQLGADVPVCLDPGPTVMTGVGDQLRRVPTLPPCGIVLVNPGVPISTPEVFKVLKYKKNTAMPTVPAGLEKASDLADWLRDQRNDLQDAATHIAPEIHAVIQTLATSQHCLLARMSGSGATCFGLFSTEEQAQLAGHEIKENYPDWWTAASTI